MVNLEDFNLDLDPEEVIKAGKFAELDMSEDGDTQRVQGLNEDFEGRSKDTEDLGNLDKGSSSFRS